MIARAPKQKIDLCFFAFSVLSVFAILGRRYQSLLEDPDTLWHVRLGKSIVQDGWPGGIERFSHTYKGKPFIEVEWLSQVFYYLAFEWAGWAGTVLLALCAISLTAVILYWAFSEHLKPLYACLFAVLLPVVIAPTLAARPHVLALPLMTFWTWRLFRAAARQRAPEFWLLLLLPVWVNLHPSYAMGCFIAGVALLDVAFETKLSDKRLLGHWLLFLAACPVLVALNPNGLKPALIAVHVATDNNVLRGISEWQPYSLGLWFVLDAAFFAAYVFFVALRPKLPPVRIAFAVFALYIFMKHIRFAFVFALLLPLALVRYVAQQFPRVSKQEWSKEPPDPVERGLVRAFAVILPAMGLALLLTAAWIIRLKPLPAALQSADKVMAFIDAQQPMGKVFNGYNFGGLLIFNDIPVFIDGRTDQLYLGKFWDDYAATASAGGQPTLSRILERYDIRWTLFAPEDTRNLLLARLPNWHKAYADDFAVIYRKN